MKHVIPFLFCIVIAQESYEGQITLDYNGTVNGSFNSIVQDSVLTGFAYNQIGLDTSFFLMASITQQDTNEFDLFVTFLQDTTFPVQPRTWEIPGGGDETNPLSFQNIVVLIPGIDSTFVNDLFGFFTDSSSFGDSLNLDSAFANIFLEFADDIYLGFSGELEISDITDSTLVGNFNSIMIKPEFHIPPHLVMVNNGEFAFNKVTLPDLTLSEESSVPRSILLSPAYPNPFNPETTLEFSLSQANHTSITIFDINGKIVETLIDQSIQPGTYQIRWNAGNQPNGIYFARIQSGQLNQTNKLILVK